jgi:RNA polymerase sigma factor (sigma-70 family)
MTEKELVEGCIREDRICQRELWDRYSKKLMSLCLRYCNSQEEAEDALMEAYVKIYDNLKNFRFQSSLETWMRRVSVNLCINKIRARKHIWTSISDDEYRIGFKDDAFDNLQVQHIMKMVEALPVGYRTVFNYMQLRGTTTKILVRCWGLMRGQVVRSLRKLVRHYKFK